MNTPCDLRPGNPERYSRKWANGRYLMSYHRWVYEQAHGPVPDGWVVDHLCEQKRCVRLDHLEAVTVGENNRRATSFGRFAEAGRKHAASLRLPSRPCRVCAQPTPQRRTYCSDECWLTHLAEQYDDLMAGAHTNRA